MSESVYFCPHGCEGAKRPITSLGGWKRHMTAKHGGYNDAELEAVVASVPAPAPSPDGSAPEVSTVGKEAFLKENEAEKPRSEKTPARSTEDLERERAVEMKTDQMGKRFSNKLNKMKTRIAEQFPKALGKAVAERGPDWALDKDDTELLQESVENCFEVLDIDFKITPFNTVLTNPLWVLILPALALLLVFLPKSIAAAQHARNEKEDAERVPVHTDERTAA